MKFVKGGVRMRLPSQLIIVFAGSLLLINLPYTGLRALFNDAIPYPYALAVGVTLTVLLTYFFVTLHTEKILGILLSLVMGMLVLCSSMLLILNMRGS